MKIDQDMLAAFREGNTAGECGDSPRANPYLYTSDMSDAWELGRNLSATRRIEEIHRILGMSSRGLTYADREGRRFRYRVAYITCTQGHEIWRAAA